jgi:hypothetical protein
MRIGLSQEVVSALKSAFWTSTATTVFFFAFLYHLAPLAGAPGVSAEKSLWGATLFGGTAFLCVLLVCVVGNALRHFPPPSRPDDACNDEKT